MVELPSGQTGPVAIDAPVGSAVPTGPTAPVVPTAATVPAAVVTPTVAAIQSVPATPALPVAAATVAPVTTPPTRAATPGPGANLGLPSLRMADELSAPANAAAPPRKAAAPKPAKLAAAPKPQEQAVAAPVPSRPPVVALPREPSVAGEGRIDKQSRLPPPAERAEFEYKRGILAQRQGNLDEAAGRYRAALEDYPEHAAARQTLAGLLIEAKRFDDAEELLRKGTELVSVRLASTLALARLKVERNQSPAALDLLLKHAASGERSAEYQGFAAALLNRAGRAPEAVERYQAATRLAPNEGRWWAGLGIALEAAGKPAEAREAYQKARALPGLPADLAQHIEQRMR